MDEKIKLSTVQIFWDLKYPNAFTPKQLEVLLNLINSKYKDKIKNVDSVKINDDIISLLIDISDKEHVLIKDNIIKLITDENDEKIIKTKLNKIGATINSIIGDGLGKYEVAFDTEKIIFDNFDLNTELLKNNLFERLKSYYSEYGNLILVSCTLALMPKKDKEDAGTLIVVGHNTPKDHENKKITFMIENEQMGAFSEKFQ